MNNSSSIDFTRPGEGIYLLNHSVGRLPIGARAAVEQDFFSIWDNDPEQAWPVWLEKIEQFRSLLGEWFNSPAQTFCPQANVSSGLGKVLGAMLTDHAQARLKVAFTENDFPSIGFVFDRHRRLGLTPHMLSKQADPQDISCWEKLLSADVQAVLITHVHYNTNRLIPVAQITELARQRGIVSIVDIAQSAGVVPIDFTEWNADVVLGSCIKWLCGGPGAGFLWINPDSLDRLEPVDVGWFSHQDPFEFDINHFAYAHDSLRFWGGTPSVMPAIVASHSITELSKFGIGLIHQHNQRLSQQLIDQLGADSMASPVDVSAKGGTSVVRLRKQQQAIAALRSTNVKFDAREYGIRLSPHIYNTADEIAQVIETLQPFR